MEAILLSLLGSLLIIALALVGFRGTVLDLSFARKNLWPLLWYEQLALVLVPLFVVSALGIDGLDVFFVAQPGLELNVALVVLLSLLSYVGGLIVFLRFIRFKTVCRESIYVIEKLDRFALAALLLSLALVVLFSFLSFRHAFLEALFRGTPLLEVRLANVYGSRVPSQLLSLLLLLSYVLSIAAGYVMQWKKGRGLIYWGFALFFAAAPGNKAPIVVSVVLFVLSYATSLSGKISFLRISSTIFLLPVGGLLLYFAVSLQMPGLTPVEFGRYLLNRLGAGQMAGVYETYALAEQGSIPEGAYYWHAIPFARFFVDYVDYQKMLMMVTEGYAYEEMGVKNTLFIAEAYAIGGLPLAVASPLIVAFSTAIGLALLFKVLKWFFSSEVAVLFTVPLYLLTHNITGGFSHYPLLKGLLLLIFQLMLLWASYVCVGLLFQKRPSGKGGNLE